MVLDLKLVLLSIITPVPSKWVECRCLFHANANTANRMHRKQQYPSSSSGEASRPYTYIWRLSNAVLCYIALRF